MFLAVAVAFVHCFGSLLSCSVGSWRCSAATALLPASQSARAPAGGMGDRTVPTQGYHAAFLDFYVGDYGSALRHFQADSLASIKTAQSRWIDSICYETMQGECYYQMGQYPDALAHYTDALEIYQAFPTWLSKVVCSRSGRHRREEAAPWQVRRLQAPLGVLPYRMSLGQGNFNTSSEVRRAGSLSRPTCFPSSPRRSFAVRRWPFAAAASCSGRWPPTIR